MENTSSSLEAIEPPKKKPSLRKWILLGCGGCLAASLLLLGSCFLVVKGAMKVGENKFGPTCELYLAHINAENYDAAYAEFDQDLKAVITQDKHEAMLKAVNRKLGHLVSKSVENVHTGIDLSGSWAKIDYTAKFANGNGTVRFGLKKRDGKWKIVQFNYNSPLLLDLMLEPKQ